MFVLSRIGQIRPECIWARSRPGRLRPRGPSRSFAICNPFTQRARTLSGGPFDPSFARRGEYQERRIVQGWNASTTPRASFWEGRLLRNLARRPAPRSISPSDGRCVSLSIQAESTAPWRSIVNATTFPGEQEYRSHHRVGSPTSGRYPCKSCRAGANRPRSVSHRLRGPRARARASMGVMRREARSRAARYSERPRRHVAALAAKLGEPA